MLTPGTGGVVFSKDAPFPDRVDSACMPVIPFLRTIASAILRNIAAAARGANTPAACWRNASDAGTTNARQYPARRIRTISREQRPVVLPAHGARGSCEEVARGQESHPVQNAEGRFTHSARSARGAEH